MGSLLAGLGLIVSVNATVRAILYTPPTLSPLDQSDDIIAPEAGLAPLILPTIHPNIVALRDQAQLPPLTLSLTETPAPNWIPNRIVIPVIQLDAPVVLAALKTISYQGKIYPQWKVPNFFAAGWAPTSASLGTLDNTVLFGHHNEDGEVFAHLVDLQVNDVILLYSGEKEFAYVVALKMILRERNEPVDVRLQNASWILPSQDERLTLLTCWPYATNTHRLIIVAIPISVDYLYNRSFTPRLIPLAPLIQKEGEGN